MKNQTKMLLLTPNNSKNFLINCSDIDGRFDAEYYNPSLVSKIKLIKEANSIKLSTKIKKLQTGFNSEQNIEGKGIKFARTQNVRPLKLDLKSAAYTNDLLVRIPKKGSIIFTRIGVNVGDVAYNDLGNFAISDNVIAVEFDDEIFAEYCCVFLNTEIGQSFIEREKRDTARAIISYQNIRNIFVFIFDRSKQKEVIRKINSA
ncbi:MAG: hypothetical protein NTW22_07535, partial [Proteobacteria bacterium]|nr:hypothetical protein [Pseudomonadota bacterium]